MLNSISSSQSSIEHSVWVKNWGALPDPQKLPLGVNTINIFEGKIDCDNGTWIINGLNWSASLLKEYIEACHAHNISVKISLGGAGGQEIYNNTWDQLTDENVEKMGQDLAAFCKQNNIDGIDFDYEEQKSDEQRTLVGKLIKSFKEACPTLKTSVCTCPGNDGTARYPWQSYLEQILNASQMLNGKIAVDRFYIMSYDYAGETLESDESFMSYWKTFGQKYNLNPSRISIGLDPTNSSFSLESQNAYIKFAKENLFSTAIWDGIDFNEGKYTQQVTDEYNQS